MPQELMRDPKTKCIENPDEDPKFCAKRKVTCGYPNTLVLYHKTYQRYIDNGNVFLWRCANSAILTSLTSW